MKGKRWVIPTFVVALLLGSPAAQAGHRDRPSRVLIVVLDQVRPDTIQRYGMENVQTLMRGGSASPTPSLVTWPPRR
jgi:predicted AlkP superfamily pyrophosphatase or phosphodiesterase